MQPADVTIVGFGPGQWSKLTLEVHDLLMQADRIYTRDPLSWEVLRELKARGKNVISLSSLYLLGLPVGELYDLMADVVARSALRYGPLVYALPGNPLVFEFPTLLVRRRALALGLSCYIVEGMSCLEAMFVANNIDPGFGLQILNLVDFEAKPRLIPSVATLMFQVGAPRHVFRDQSEPDCCNLSWLRDRLIELDYPPEHKVYLLKPGEDGQQISVVGKVSRMERLKPHLNSMCTLYIPPNWIVT